MRRVLHLSGDGTKAILDLDDVPSGVPRSRTESAGMYTGADAFEQAVRALSQDVGRPIEGGSYTGRGPGVYTRHWFACWVYTSDLQKRGWTPSELGVVQGTFSTVTPVQRPTRVLKDWPLTCPRCNRAESAIQLFTSVECRHGCFARGAS